MRIRWFLAIAVVAGLIGCGIALSQNASQPPPTPVDKTISKREWYRMKRQWEKQADKWASCNNKADDQKLSGRKSWSFIAGCMTS